VTLGCFSEIVKSFERGAELEQELELWGRVRMGHRFSGCYTSLAASSSYEVYEIASTQARRFARPSRLSLHLEFAERLETGPGP